MEQYTQAFNQAATNPSAFWLEQASKISWHKAPTQGVTPNGEHLYQWFADGQLNTSYLCLDAHIEAGRGDENALIYDSPVTNTVKYYTYKELLDKVMALAAGLEELGLAQGDRAVIYMPMIPEAAIAMLACARLGVIHSVVFGGFAARELAIRLDDATPKVIITADAGIEINRTIDYKPLVNEAIALANHSPEHVVFYKRGITKNIPALDIDIDWADVCLEGVHVEPTWVKSTDPLYILYTSGTTGKPKGIIRDNGGHAVVLNYSMEAVYGMKKGEVYWAASDVGWVVGHSYIIYAPLIYGCTTVLFEGKPIKTPDAGTFWRVISAHKVATMFTAPTAIRAIRKEDPNASFLEGIDLSHFRAQFLAGERCDADTLEWTQKVLGVPVVDHWWQTESGWPMLANPLGYGEPVVKPGSASFPVPGYQVEILRPNGEKADPMEEGMVCVKLPLPPGALPNLWQDTDRFIKGYLSPVPGYYFSGDGGYIDQDGYYFITGRVDDVINVAGHRLSTAEMEEVIASHSGVAECACFGIHCDLKGQVPMAMVVSTGAVDTDELVSELKSMIRAQIGAIASLREVLLVQRLPKTRSGKILRKTLRAIVDGKPYKMPSTIDDPTTLSEIEELLKH